MTSLLCARSVARLYGAHVALQPTDLDVGAETLALVGLNGAGKSTLLSLQAGALCHVRGLSPAMARWTGRERNVTEFARSNLVGMSVPRLRLAP